MKQFKNITKRLAVLCLAAAMAIVLLPGRVQVQAKTITKNMTLYVGEEYTYSCQLKSSDVKSSNSKIVSATKGKKYDTQIDFKAKKVGKAIVSAKLDGKATTFNVTVKKANVSVTMAAAEKIPISSVEDLMNMENDPDGDYYLTQDIALPKDMRTLFPDYDLQFTGTLDGKGHKLKNYTVKSTNPEGLWQVETGIFGRAKNATFKNLSLTNVNVNVDAGEGGACVCTLVKQAQECKFDKIKVSGKITITGDSKGTGEIKGGGAFEVGGLIYSGSTNCKLTNCSSSLKIKVNAGRTDRLYVGGLARSVDGSLKNCSFSGSVSASIRTGTSNSSNYIAAGISESLGSETTLSGCKNSGNITLNVKKGNSDVAECIGAYGISGGLMMKVSSCGNSGKIKVSVSGVKSEARAAGLVDEVYGEENTLSMTKSWNTGSVNVTGPDIVCAAGLCVRTSRLDQCYNKGAITASGGKKLSTIDTTSKVGGLCTYANRIRNCYNVGKVTLKSEGYAGGLSSSIVTDPEFGASTGNYSTGTVTAKGGSYYGAALFASCQDFAMTDKCLIYDNYYSGAKAAYGGGTNPDPSVQKRSPKAKKVSSITSANCPKLSSKYWTYSSKYKRMILKNNKERS